MVLIPTIESYFVTVKVRAELIGGILTEVINILIFVQFKKTGDRIMLTTKNYSLCIFALNLHNQ